MNEGKFFTFLAIDLGASSGRAILGTIQNDQLSMKEIRRFPNPIIEVNNRQYWDLFSLYQQVIESLKEVRQLTQSVTSVGIDTWGVDYVCFANDGEPLRMPYSYRDHRTNGAAERFLTNWQKGAHQRTGIQIMDFNTIFQLIPNRKKRTQSSHHR